MNKYTQKPVYVVIGTRAELIKMAPIMLELEKRDIKYKFLHTGQHKATIDGMLDDFGIKTKYTKIVDIKDEARSIKLFLLWLIKALILLINPLSNKRIIPNGKGIFIVHGDTSSTAWSAIYAKTRGCKVMHVESGLRSYNIFEPFPEELQRLTTFHFADYYVCPNEWALNNLKKYKGEKINTHANTLYDAVQIAERNSNSDSIKENIKKMNLPDKYALVSIHRYENVFNEQRYKFILETLKNIAKKIDLVIILHLVTEKKFISTGVLKELEDNPNIHLVPRQNFFSFISINEKSSFVITDGGSNQEEMSYIGTPTILFRNKTERTEGIGKNIVLSNLDINIINEFVDNYEKYSSEPLELDTNPSEMIIDFLQKKL